MVLTPETNAFFDQLTRLFARMDHAYNETALGLGFECRGCRDNCCRTLFYHHTLAEFLYLRRGLAELPTPEQVRIRTRAADAHHRTMAADPAIGSPRIMCPLNTEGRCVLYSHRPMICRLHGIPHFFHLPDGRRQTGPGCADFESHCGSSGAPGLNRTPLYQALSALERDIRVLAQFSGRLKMTVAEILIDERVAGGLGPKVLCPGPDEL
jgi:Fe-S-cluster containining protein